MTALPEPPHANSFIAPSASQMGNGLERPKRREDVCVRIVDGETVVFDPQARLIHQLNHTASYIWEHCDGTQTVADIARELAQAFDIDAVAATTDVVAMIAQLRSLRLLALEGC